MDPNASIGTVVAKALTLPTMKTRRETAVHAREAGASSASKNFPEHLKYILK